MSCNPARSLAFSQKRELSLDGKFVASAGSSDKTMKIWDIQTSECIATLKGHTGDVVSVSFSGNGNSLASNRENLGVNINGKWYCDRIFSAIESPLSAHNAKVEHVIVSQRNKNLLKQLVAKDKMNSEEEKANENKDEESDETEGEMKYNLILAQEAAIEFSEPFRKKNKARHEELLNKNLSS